MCETENSLLYQAGPLSSGSGSGAPGAPTKVPHDNEAASAGTTHSAGWQGTGARTWHTALMGCGHWAGLLWGLSTGFTRRGEIEWKFAVS